MRKSVALNPDIDIHTTSTAVPGFFVSEEGEGGGTGALSGN